MDGVSGQSLEREDMILDRLRAKRKLKEDTKALGSESEHGSLFSLFIGKKLLGVHQNRHPHLQ